ncbi:C-type lectin domain family 4 member A-like [Cottoperca gobio]|uniref:C-type lectin domain family 4 member A-like n=1 Tax=Cottoperca gobio TaxID=56716 RepID=A0A6J2REU3_COTGO|nr:C-type lectin domain family 4 member A-like [Cottoperca gobio]
MEEELDYTTVIFKTNGFRAHENPNNLEIIYAEVKTWQEQIWNTNPVIPENEKKAPLYTVLHLVAVALGIICLILVSVVSAVSIHFNTVMSEQRRENVNLTAQNLQLWTEMTDLERQTKDLTRERDGLNWTVEVILEYQNFAVDAHCPQKVCKPCLDDWMLFQSNCYLFSTLTYSYDWKTWQGSHDQCKEMKANLLVIESQEEQEFINNHTERYNDDMHGYWIGLKKKDAWTWVDGSNFTVMYWKRQQTSNRVSCGLTQQYADPLANWSKASCEMKNRWICEKRALMKAN